MYEYTIINTKTNTEEIIYGYSWNNALRRARLDESEAKLMRYDYID